METFPFVPFPISHFPSPSLSKNICVCIVHIYCNHSTFKFEVSKYCYKFEENVKTSCSHQVDEFGNLYYCIINFGFEFVGCLICKILNQHQYIFEMEKSEKRDDASIAWKMENEKWICKTKTVHKYNCLCCCNFIFNKYFSFRYRILFLFNEIFISFKS